MAQKIKIVIADDHSLVRESIAIALACDKSFSVVGQAENGEKLMVIVEKTNPDVIILDLQMPVMNGWQALDLLKQNHPKCRVVLISTHFDGLVIKDLVAKGAHGFLPKNCDFESLIGAIHEVYNLHYFFSNQIQKAIVKELLMTNAINPTFGETKLNDNETKTLLLICEDKLSKDMAPILKVTERTVERYKTGLYLKTKAKTTGGLVLYALKNNIFTL